MNPTAPMGILDYIGGRSVQEVLADDRKRDWRNAERRHIIKQQTSKRRDSLIDSLLIAKDIVDSHARNKEYEQKASKRRHKIQQYNRFLAGTLGKNKRRLSLADEVNNACFMIAPKSVAIDSKEKARKTRRKIKKELSRKRRASFLNQIQVAQSTILDPANSFYYDATDEVRGSFNSQHKFPRDLLRLDVACVSIKFGPIYHREDSLVKAL